MTTDRRRGRPKGTGINDHETLLKIAGLIAANPNMKRTTAIKQAGISNPSVIRRLRDKYQEQEHALLAEVAATTAKASKPAAKAETAKKHPAGASAQSPRAAAASAITEEAISASSAQAKPAGASIDPLAAIFEGLNIETLVCQFVGRVLGIDAKDFDKSPITAMIRQQAQLADLVLPLLISQLNTNVAAKAA